MAVDDDILRNAGRLFSKLGSSVKKATKAVTGVGLGSLRLELEATRFAPGDPVRGRLTLVLPEPLDARRLVVGLRAHQRTVDYQRTGGVRTVGTSRATLYRFDQELAGAERYDSGERFFALAIPTDAIARQAPAPDGKLGDVARAVSSVIAPAAGPIEWTIVATLEIPLSRNLEHSVDISVG